MIRMPGERAGRGVGCPACDGELRSDRGPRAAPCARARRRRLGHARRRRFDARAARGGPARRARGADGPGTPVDVVGCCPPSRIRRRSSASASTTPSTRTRARRAAGEPDLLRQVRERAAADGETVTCRRRARRSTTRPRSPSSSGAAPATSPRPRRSTTSPATRCSTTSRPATCSSRPRSGCPERSSTARRCGPAIVTADEAGPADAIGIALDLNGERMQEDTTAGLIFSIPELSPTSRV